MVKYLYLEHVKKIIANRTCLKFSLTFWFIITSLNQPLTHTPLTHSLGSFWSNLFYFSIIVRYSRGIRILRLLNWPERLINSPTRMRRLRIVKESTQCRLERNWTILHNLVMTYTRRVNGLAIIRNGCYGSPLSSRQLLGGKSVLAHYQLLLHLQNGQPSLPGQHQQMRL